MRYGLSYKGSKNKLAEKIVIQLPKRKNFYDLFCGGCAVTHAALVSGKWENYFINDIDPLMPELFYNSIHGKYHNEKRWISREDFNRFKDTDGYIKSCWSFGNNGTDYLYSVEVEPWKKALHYARVLNDFSLLKEMGIDTDDATRVWISKHHNEVKEKYIAWAIKHFEFTQEEISLYKELEKKGTFDGLIWGSVGVYQLKKRLRSLERLQSLESLQRLQSLEMTCKDYRDVEIMPDSIIYCDIPYKDTDEYTSGAFDHDAFYKWCAQQKELVVVSSYEMPEDFICINQIEHRQTLGMGKHGKKGNKVMEKLFIPKHQADLISAHKQYKQLDLFEELSA